MNQDTGESCNECCNSGYIKWSVISVATLLSIFLFDEAIGQFQGLKYIGTDPQNRNTISINGKGEVLAKPDIAIFSFAVEKEAVEVADAQKLSAEKMNVIIDALKTAGVSEKDIKTINYTLYPRYDYMRDVETGLSGKQVFRGYTVSQDITVKVRKIEDAGMLIGKVGSLGATNISSLTFTNDKQDDLKKEARGKAIADAKIDAEKLAKDLGVSIVRIVGFSENGGYQPAMMYAKTRLAAASDSASPEVPAGENNITSLVTVTYEVK